MCPFLGCFGDKIAFLNICSFSEFLYHFRSWVVHSSSHKGSGPFIDLVQIAVPQFLTGSTWKNFLPAITTYVRVMGCNVNKCHCNCRCPLVMQNIFRVSLIWWAPDYILKEVGVNLFTSIACSLSDICGAVVRTCSLARGSHTESPNLLCRAVATGFTLPSLPHSSAWPFSSSRRSRRVALEVHLLARVTSVKRSMKQSTSPWPLNCGASNSYDGLLCQCDYKYLQCLHQPAILQIYLS